MGVKVFTTDNVVSELKNYKWIFKANNSIRNYFIGNTKLGARAKFGTRNYDYLSDKLPAVMRSRSRLECPAMAPP